MSAAAAALAAELGALKIGALSKHAVAAGVDGDALEAAQDEGDLAGIIALIVAQTVRVVDPAEDLRTELRTLKLGALSRRAVAAGVDEGALEAAQDKGGEALVELIVQVTAAISKGVPDDETLTAGQLNSSTVGPALSPEAGPTVVPQAAHNRARSQTSDSDEPEPEICLFPTQLRHCVNGRVLARPFSIPLGQPPAQQAPQRKSQSSNAVLQGRVQHYGHGKAASSRALEADLAALAAMELGDLFTHAETEGVAEADLTDALDADDPKSTIIALLVKKAQPQEPDLQKRGQRSLILRTELENLRLGALKLRATSEGLAHMEITRALNSGGDPKHALVLLLLERQDEVEDQLASLTVMQLCSLAQEEAYGATGEQVESALADAREPLIALILSLVKRVGSSPLASSPGRNDAVLLHSPASKSPAAEQAAKYVTCLDRHYVQKEIRWAIKYGKQIIVVVEKDRDRPGYFDYNAAMEKYQGTEWEHILHNEGIAFHREGFHTEAMLQNIFAVCSSRSMNHRRSTPGVAFNDPGHWDFFLSHHQARGGDQVQLMCVHMKAAGKLVWYDQVMINKSEQAMEEGVRQSDYFVVFLTAEPKVEDVGVLCPQCELKPIVEDYDYCSKRCAKKAEREKRVEQLLEERHVEQKLEPSAMRQLPSTASVMVHCSPDSDLFSLASSQLESTWTKDELYEINEIVEVLQIRNNALTKRYEEYRSRLPAGNEITLFHGCSDSAIVSIAEQGFLKSKQKTGTWQRFGHGFYFAKDSSKAHEYPLDDMDSLTKGTDHTRSLLMCKVARGKVLKTTEDIKHLTEAPRGYHSVHGQATKGRKGGLKYDEIVVYEEAAVLPYAVVKYRFTKKVEGMKVLLCKHCGKKDALAPFEFCGLYCAKEAGALRGEAASTAWVAVPPGMCPFCGVKTIADDETYCSEKCNHDARTAGWSDGRPSDAPAKGTTICPFCKANPVTPFQYCSTLPGATADYCSEKC
eukprot:COSAG01_NODE_3950_length_5502_cov_2.057561_1_plen_979_part_00